MHDIRLSCNTSLAAVTELRKQDFAVKLEALLFMLGNNNL